jgi:hypothetical protein
MTWQEVRDLLGAEGADDGKGFVAEVAGEQLFVRRVRESHGDGLVALARIGEAKRFSLDAALRENVSIPWSAYAIVGTDLVLRFAARLASLHPILLAEAITALARGAAERRRPPVSPIPID